MHPVHSNFFWTHLSDTKNWENALLDIAKLYDKIEGNFTPTENGLSTKFEKRGKTVHFAQEDTTIDMNDAELLQYQDQIIQEQDTHLDHLSQVLNRHKDIGMKLADELNYQAELLEQTEDAIENTRDRVRTVDRRMNSVMATDSGRFSSNILMTLMISDKLHHNSSHYPNHCDCFG